jgi:cyclomaltodextrinase
MRRAFATRFLRNFHLVTPAKAGAQLPPLSLSRITSNGESWVPAFAGMTSRKASSVLVSSTRRTSASRSRRISVRSFLILGLALASSATLLPAAHAQTPNASASCRSDPYGKRDLYLRGSFNTWSTDDAHRFTWTCDRYELVTRLDGAQRFKVGDADWSADADFGVAADAKPGPPWTLAAKGGDIPHTFAGPVRLVLAMPTTPAAPALSVAACDEAPLGDAVLFLRGSMNAWTALEDYAFKFHCDAYYLNVRLDGRQEFKVADAGWTDARSFGGPGGQGTDLAVTGTPLGRGDEAGGAGNLVYAFAGEHTLRLAFPGGRPTLSVGPRTFVDPDERAVEDPVALGLRHDSRDLADRAPFGAVPAGTTIGFALNADPGVESATLVLETRRLEGNQDVLEYQPLARVPMRREVGTDGRERWRASYGFTQPAVVGYWFAVRIDGVEYAYQNNRDPLHWTREKGSNGVGSVDVARPSPRRYRMTVFDPAFTVPGWAADAVYYYVFPDRFRNGDPSNDPRPGRARYQDKDVEHHANWLDKPWKPGDGSDAVYNNDFFGGDIAGLIDKLDYIAALGANTLYLTPVFRAASNHKYDTADYLHVDPGFGRDEDFARLTAAAAEHGIRVIPDTSLNHTGSDSIYFDRYGNFGGKGAFANGHINPDSPYADWFTFDATQTDPDRQFRGWVGVRDLPELNKASQGFRDFAYRKPDSVMKLWLDRGAAGWRMDVAPWVPDDFWREWRTEIRAHTPDALLIAETWFDASKFFLGDTFDSTMNYIFRNAVLDFAAGRDAAAAYRHLEYLREAYPPQAFHALMNLLSTHDSARSLHVLGDHGPGTDPAAVALARQRFRLALFFQLTYPGAPAIFYGDEVGVTGGDDPFNRVPYPWPDLGGKPDEAMHAEIKQLLALRKANPVLSRGRLHAPLHTDAQSVVLLRELGEAWAIVASNNGTTAQTLTVTLPTELADRDFTDALGGTKLRAQGTRLRLDVPAMYGTVLFAR